MTLQKEIKKLNALIGKDHILFTKQLQHIKDNFTSSDDLQIIDAFIRKQMAKTTANLKGFNKEVSVKIKLEEISSIISVSYIAKEYFNKSRQWFYQRLNNNTVNGKQAQFTDKELQRLDYALKDISKKIGSVSIL